MKRINLRHVWIVAKKEFTDTLRDRRTWIVMVVVPLVLVPVLLLLAPMAVTSQMTKVEEAVARVAVVGSSDAQGFMDFAAQTPGVAFEPAGENPEASLASRDVQAVLYLPAGFDVDIAAEKQVTVEVAYDAADQRSSSAYQKLMTIIGSYSGQVAQSRLASRGIDPAILSPVATTSRNVAPPAKMGGVFLSMVMPMMIALWAVTGGMYAAIDATAGEKERGTLELLLSAPPSRSSIALGKFVVVTTTALISGIISVAAMLGTFMLKPEVLIGVTSGADANIAVALPVGRLGLIILASVGVAAIFAAVELAVSLFARGFREAQTYLTPLSFLVVLPGIATQFMPAADAAGWVFWVPLLNAIFFYKEILEGTANIGHFSAVVISSLVLAVLCFRVMVSLFRKESVLFRS